MKKKHRIILLIINLIASFIVPLIYAFSVVYNITVLKIYIPFVFAIIVGSWIVQFIAYVVADD
jgi:hypothetical protein